MCPRAAASLRRVGRSWARTVLRPFAFGVLRPLLQQLVPVLVQGGVCVSGGVAPRLLEHALRIGGRIRRVLATCGSLPCRTMRSRPARGRARHRPRSVNSRRRERERISVRSQRNDCCSTGTSSCQVSSTGPAMKRAGASGGWTAARDGRGWPSSARAGSGRRRRRGGRRKGRRARPRGRCASAVRRRILLRHRGGAGRC